MFFVLLADVVLCGVLCASCFACVVVVFGFVCIGVFALVLVWGLVRFEACVVCFVVV